MKLLKKHLMIATLKVLQVLCNGYAVNVLSMSWKYGEELRNWHNKKYGYTGDGTVNPAMLTVEAD